MRNIIIVLASISLISCSTNTSFSLTERSYRRSDIFLENVFNLEEEEYLVYFYSDSCLHCLNLKKTISDFYSTGKIAFFKVKIDSSYQGEFYPVAETIGSRSYENVFAGSTPQLSLIINHEVVNAVVGEEDVKLLLSTFIM